MTSDQSLRHADVDGVPTYWIASGRGDGDHTDGMRASLLFRAGMADLPLVQHGWLHLLEHSALHGEDLIRRPVNGAVGLLQTAFHVQGSAEDVTAFLAKLCRWLADPQLDDLDHERRVLRAEAGQRTRGPLGRHLLWRYGARGPGLAGYDEFGLFTADSAGLRELAARAFTAGNAALALNGAPPADLTLPLAAGMRQPTQAPVPCDQRYPAGFTDPVGGIAVSGTLPRSVAATALGRLLTRALHARIRGRDGVGYSAWSAYEPVGADIAAVAAGIDVLPEGRDGLVEAVWGIINSVANGDTAAEDLRDDAQRSLVEMRQNEPSRWVPWMAAQDALLGRPVQDHAALEAEILAVTGEDLQHAAARFRDSLLLGVDAGVPRGRSLPWLDTVPGGSAIDGRVFKPVDHPIRQATLTIGDGVAQFVDGSNRITVGSRGVAAALAFPDGGRSLIRFDGYQLGVEPTLWRHGSDAVALIDEMTDPAIRVSMPPREPGAVPKPRTRRWNRALYRFRRQATKWLAVLALFAIALLPAGVVAAVTHVPLLGTATFAGACWTIVGFLRRRTERIWAQVEATAGTRRD